MQTRFAVKKELGGTIAEVAFLEYAVDPLELVGKVGEFVFKGAQIAFAESFPSLESEHLNFVVVVVRKFVGGAEANVQSGSDGAAAFAFGAEFNDLVDDVLGMHELVES